MHRLPKTNIELNTYYKKIKSLFPIYGNQEKQYLNALHNNISDFIKDNPNCTYEDIIATYGAPEDIIAEYFAEINMDELHKKICTAKFIKIAIAICVLIILSVCVIKGALIYKAYLDGKHAVIVKEVTEVE